MKILSGSILDPSDDAAVIGGNVLTCQRVVDVVFKAFSACAASQGCMNNITFGDHSFGYYETVAGGAGAVSHLYSFFCILVIVTAGIHHIKFMVPVYIEHGV